MSAAVREATARPERHDRFGVLACTSYQVVVIIAVAATVQVAPSAQQNGPAGVGTLFELFGHNALVFSMWLAGAATLGLMSLVLSTMSATISGLTIGAAISVHGLSSLLYLGHGVLELPALGIALWLSLRPLRWVLQSRWGSTEPEPFLRAMRAGSLWWLGCAMVLLAGAAVWETLVVPPW